MSLVSYPRTPTEKGYLLWKKQLNQVFLQVASTSLLKAGQEVQPQGDAWL